MKSARNSRLPVGWSDAHVADVIAHYETQSEDEAVAEDEAALSDPGQTVMVIPTRLAPAVRELLASTPTYAAALLAAVEKYRFPTITYDFGRNREIRHADMAGVETYIGRQLQAQDPKVVEYGLANVLYWGYANSPGRRDHRVDRFRNNVKNIKDKIDNFIALVGSTRTPDLLDIKRIGLPEFGGLSFVSKVMMFLDPNRYPVLDLKIAEAFSKVAEFPPLKDLVFRKRADFGSNADTCIRITRKNERVYGMWASWCRHIAASVNAASSSGNSIRAVDVERAVFALADLCDRKAAWCLLRGPEGRTGQARAEETAG